MKAAGSGIPVHTIWVENENLQSFSHQAGQDYLSQLAQATGGLHAQLGQADAIQAILIVIRKSTIPQKARLVQQACI